MTGLVKGGRVRLWVRGRTDPLAFIHVISIVAHKNLTYIVRSMIFNAVNPVPNIYRCEDARQTPSLIY